MTINEMWAEFKKKLNDIYSGITVAEYGNSQRGGKIVRGPHVTLMIPADSEKPCPHCGKGIEDVLPEPTSATVKKLQALVNSYLCSVTWDGVIQTENHGGGIYKGKYYKIEFDKVVS